MKKSFLFIFLAILSLSLFSGMEAFAQKNTEGLSPLNSQIKNRILLHFTSLEKKDQAAFKKSISQIFPSRSVIADVYSLSVMHYPQCQGALIINKARQIPLKLLNKKHSLGFDGKGNDVVIEEGFLVLIPLKKKLAFSQRLPLDAMKLANIKSFSSGYGFPPSYSMAFIVDKKGFSWGGDSP